MKCLDLVGICLLLIVLCYLVYRQKPLHRPSAERLMLRH